MPEGEEDEGEEEGGGGEGQISQSERETTPSYILQTICVCCDQIFTFSFNFLTQHCKLLILKYCSGRVPKHILPLHDYEKYILETVVKNLSYLLVQT
jgi:hypothetical protein